MSELTKKEVRYLFDYNAKTGELIRKVQTSNRVKIGDVVGSINSRGYLQVRINNRLRTVHRIVFLWHYGTMPKDQIDHINQTKTDNRIENLRDVTNTVNSMNSSLSSRNRSGFNGVHWNARLKKWNAAITVNYKRISLGWFDKLNSAIECRKKANIDYGFHTNHGIKSKGGL